MPIVFVGLFFAEYYFEDQFIPRSPGDLILFVFCIFSVVFLLSNLCDYIKAKSVKNKVISACKSCDVMFFSSLMNEPDQEKEIKYILKLKENIRSLKPEREDLEKITKELSDYISAKRLQDLIEEAEISHMFDKNKGISYHNLFHVLDKVARENTIYKID